MYSSSQNIVPSSPIKREVLQHWPADVGGWMGKIQETPLLQFKEVESQHSMVNETNSQSIFSGSNLVADFNLSVGADINSNAKVQSEWISPQQFVPSGTYPYFKMTTPIQPPLYSNYLTFSIPTDNYVPNSCPALDELLQTIPTPISMQQCSGKHYTVKSNFSYGDVMAVQKLKQKTKRARTAFTAEQLLVLEEIYSRQLYISRGEREILTKRLGLSDRAIKVWFQNRRMKGKRDGQMDTSDNSDDSRISSSSSSSVFDDIEAQMKQCEVVNDYVRVPPEVYDKLGYLINHYVPNNIHMDSNIAKVTSSPIGVDSASSSSQSSPKVDASIKKRLEVLFEEDYSQKLEDDVVDDKASEDVLPKKDICNVFETIIIDNTKYEYEPISPAEGALLETAVWKPQDATEMKSLFEKHFC